MFNTTILAPRTVHEHLHLQMVYPSVEKGARFLADTEREAQRRITAAFVAEIGDTGIQVVGYDVAVNHATQIQQHRLAFKVNGVAYDVPVDIDWYDQHKAGNQIAQVVAEKISAAIIAAIAPSLMNQMLRVKRYGE